MTKSKDYRPEDIEKLESVGIETDWCMFWEKTGHKLVEVKDENQRDWHLSRLSFLAGYLLGAKESKTQ